ncbi:hypothetical protein GJJ30_14655 [Larkinella terrae]|uniref:Uncharacterized protein n=1 Tax=Larkinella terrae TaxID=2025311 RepID=A0A7K0EL04_9BACT|nr:hypothetical protein [Larkinella terrae]
MNWIPTGISFAFVLLFSCQQAEPKRLVPAFYYWQTTFNPTPSERQLLDRQHVRKLYIRYFDVDWDQQTQSPIPKAVIRFTARPAGLQVIPVVFITNQTLIRCQTAAISDLADKLVRKINQISQQNGIDPSEIQLDCDWTATTRERYFQLLREVKNRHRGLVSVTIRLHQIKFPEQTGIPPVERGMLMFYNMADWKRPETRNSIYDLEVARRYTDFLEKYPLPLDVVLPLFRWTVVYRTNRFLTLLNNVDENTLKTFSYLKPQMENRYLALRDTNALGFSIRRGDLFRAEACKPADLEAGKQLLLSKIQNQKLTFALYHLDSTVISSYSDAFFQSLYRPYP